LGQSEHAEEETCGEGKEKNKDYRAGKSGVDGETRKTKEGVRFGREGKGCEDVRKGRRVD